MVVASAENSSDQMEMGGAGHTSGAALRAFTRPAALQGESMRWEVQLLGGFAARCGDMEIRRLPSRHATLLFARLLLEPRTEHSRRALAEWLWPEERPRKGRAEAPTTALRAKRLRGVLHDLRSSLTRAGQPELFLSNHDTVRLNSAAFNVDVHRFEACVSAGDRKGAEARYRGTLLPGLEDEWIEDHRYRLAGLLARLDSGDADEVADVPPPVLVPYVTRFVDRERELAEITTMLESERLVVVTGPGGCGKTRLCARVGEQARGFEVVHLVGMTDCLQAAQILERIGLTLRVLRGDAELQDQIVALLGGMRVLLVLDNFEQLADEPGEAVLAELLRRVPRLHLLLSSRRALRLPQARNFMLASLAVAALGALVAEASCSPSVSLFVDRARAARADFHLHERNVATVVAICERLEGLPLAIELAASRVRQFSAKDLRAALTSSYKTLALGGQRARHAGRHASLELALDWSWRLLDGQHCQALSALATFRGGFTEVQAEELMPVQGSTLLADLVRDSLVLADPSGSAQCRDDRRLKLMNSVREFVLEPERTPTIRAIELRRRHRTCFLGLARRLQGRLTPPHSADMPNFVAAMASGLDDGDAAVSLALAVALLRHFAAQGLPPGAAAVLCRVETEAPATLPGHFELACSLPRLLAHSSLVQDARAMAERALSRAAGEEQRAEAQVALGEVRWMADRDGPAVIAAAHEALATARRLQLPAVEARAAWLLGAALLGRSGAEAETAAALRLFDEAARAFESSGDQRGHLRALAGRTAGLIKLRQWQEALSMATAGAADAQRLQDLSSLLQMCSRQSTALEGLRRYDEALATCRMQVRLALSNGQSYHLHYGLWNQCALLARLRRPEDAIRLMGYSAKQWAEQFGALDKEDVRTIESIRRLVARQLGKARAQALWEEGRRMSERQAVEIGSSAG